MKYNPMPPTYRKPYKAWRKASAARLIAGILCLLVGSSFFHSNSTSLGSLYSCDSPVGPFVKDLKRHRTFFEDAKKHTIQSLLLTPEPGIVAGVGTNAFLPCPPPSYRTSNSIELTLADEIFPTKNITDLTIPLGPVVFAYFNVSVSIWNEWRTSLEPTILSVKDNQVNETYTLPVMVDPALRNGIKHSVSLTTTIRKAYKHYNGQGTEAGVKEGAEVEKWSDEDIRWLTEMWLEHHRREGIDHFYIIDNEHNSRLPNIVLSGNDITYIRSAYMDYDIMAPCHFTEFCCNVTTGEYIKNYHHVVGQLIMENSVLRMAHTEWLMSCDIDEYFVVGNSFARSIPKLLGYMEQSMCRRDPNNTDTRMICTPSFDISLGRKSDAERNSAIFAVGFWEHAVDRRGRIPDVPNQFRRKVAMKPEMTYYFSVHYPTPHIGDMQHVAHRSQEGLVVETYAPYRQGWLVHYRKDGGAFDLVKLTSKLHNYVRLM